MPPKATTSDADWTEALSQVDVPIKTTLSQARTHKRNIAQVIARLAKQGLDRASELGLRRGLDGGGHIIVRDVLDNIISTAQSLEKWLYDHPLRASSGINIPLDACSILLVRSDEVEVRKSGDLLNIVACLLRAIHRYERHRDMLVGTSVVAARDADYVLFLSGLPAIITRFLGLQIDKMQLASLKKKSKGKKKTSDISSSKQRVLVEADIYQKLEGPACQPHNSLDILHGTVIKSLFVGHPAHSHSEAFVQENSETIGDLTSWLVGGSSAAFPVAPGHKAIPNGKSWFLRDFPEFKRWSVQHSSALLHIHGPPGSGKTTTIANMIASSDGNTSTSYFGYVHCQYPSARSSCSSASATMSELVRQMILDPGRPQMLHRAASTYWHECIAHRSYNTCSAELKISHCTDIILEMLEYDPMLLIIDGIDDFATFERTLLVSTLLNLVEQSKNVLKVLVTSRGGAGIRRALAGAIDMPLGGENYLKLVEWYTHEFATSQLSDQDSSRPEAISDLLSLGRPLLIERTFVWVQTRVLHWRRGAERLGTFKDPSTATLDALYKDLYDYILTQDELQRKIALITITWMLHAGEHITQELLFQVLSTKIGWEVSASDVNAACYGFVDLSLDSERPLFVHNSAYQFLHRQYLVGPQLAQPELAKACLAQCTTWITGSAMTAFQQYAAIFWPYHCSYAESYFDQELRTALTSFLTSPCGPCTNESSDQSDSRAALAASLNFTPLTPLLIASICGFTSILESRNWSPVELEQATVNGETALHLACTSGNILVTTLLLDLGLQVNACTNSGATPLAYAASRGFSDICSLLLEHGADPGWTPVLDIFLDACNQGWASTAMLLLNNAPKLQDPAIIQLVWSAAIKAGSTDLLTALRHITPSFERKEKVTTQWQAALIPELTEAPVKAPIASALNLLTYSSSQGAVKNTAWLSKRLCNGTPLEAVLAAASAGLERQSRILLEDFSTGYILSSSKLHEILIPALRSRRFHLVKTMLAVSKERQMYYDKEAVLFEALNQGNLELSELLYRTGARLWRESTLENVFNMTFDTDCPDTLLLALRLYSRHHISLLGHAQSCEVSREMNFWFGLQILPAMTDLRATGIPRYVLTRLQDDRTEQPLRQPHCLKTLPQTKSTHVIDPLLDLENLLKPNDTKTVGTYAWPWPKGKFDRSRRGSCSSSCSEISGCASDDSETSDQHTIYRANDLRLAVEDMYDEKRKRRSNPVSDQLSGAQACSRPLPPEDSVEDAFDVVLAAAKGCTSSLRIFINHSNVFGITRDQLRLALNEAVRAGSIATVQLLLAKNGWSSRELLLATSIAAKHDRLDMVEALGSHQQSGKLSSMFLQCMMLSTTSKDSHVHQEVLRILELDFPMQQNDILLDILSDAAGDGPTHTLQLILDRVPVIELRHLLDALDRACVSTESTKVAIILNRIASMTDVDIIAREKLQVLSDAGCIDELVCLLSSTQVHATDIICSSMKSAIDSDLYDDVRKLVSGLPPGAEERSFILQSALIYAADQGRSAICQILLDHGVDTNVKLRHAPGGDLLLCILPPETTAIQRCLDRLAQGHGQNEARTESFNQTAAILIEAGAVLDLGAASESLIANIRKASPRVIRYLLEQQAEVSLTAIQEALRRKTDIFGVFSLLLLNNHELMHEEHEKEFVLVEAVSALRAQTNIDMFHDLSSRGDKKSFTTYKSTEPLIRAGLLEVVDYVLRSMKYDDSLRAKGSRTYESKGLFSAYKRYNAARSEDSEDEMDVSCFKGHMRSGRTPSREDFSLLLIQASAAGHHNAVEVLLNCKVDPNTCDRFNLTPLHLACEQDSYEICKLLLRRGADPDLKDDADRTPFSIADSEASKPTMSLLKKYGSACSTGLWRSDERIYELTREAMKDGKIYKAAELFSGHHCTQDFASQVLIYACQEADRKLYEKAIEQGADVNYFLKDMTFSGTLKCSPLVASISSEERGWKLADLLDHGADPTLDLGSMSPDPLTLTISSNNIDAFNTLIDFSQRRSSLDSVGEILASLKISNPVKPCCWKFNDKIVRSAYREALSANRLGYVSSLAKAGLQIPQDQDFVSDMFLRACEQASPSMIETYFKTLLSLSPGHEVKFRVPNLPPERCQKELLAWLDFVPCSPDIFLEACVRGYEDIVEIALEDGLNPNAEIDGCPVLHFAAAYGRVGVVKHLINAGAPRGLQHEHTMTRRKEWQHCTFGTPIRTAIEGSILPQLVKTRRLDEEGKRYASRLARQPWNKIMSVKGPVLSYDHLQNAVEIIELLLRAGLPMDETYGPLGSVFDMLLNDGLLLYFEMTLGDAWSTTDSAGKSDPIARRGLRTDWSTNKLKAQIDELLEFIPSDEHQSNDSNPAADPFANVDLSVLLTDLEVDSIMKAAGKENREAEAVCKTEQSHKYSNLRNELSAVDNKDIRSSSDDQTVVEGSTEELVESVEGSDGFTECDRASTPSSWEMT